MEKERIKANVDLYNVLKNLLTVGPVTVKFTKKDGSDRVMTCTTKPDFIPEEKRPIGEGKIAENKEVVRAFDIENEGWRSFRVDSVTSFDI